MQICLTVSCNTHLAITNFIHVLRRVNFIQMPRLCKTFKHILSSVNMWSSGQWHYLGKRLETGLLVRSNGGTFFSHLISIASRFSQFGKVITNDIQVVLHKRISSHFSCFNRNVFRTTLEYSYVNNWFLLHQNGMSQNRFLFAI